MTILVQRCYTIDSVKPSEGMAFLRAMFPDAQADDMNFVIFSTSGVHGTYSTIENVAESLGTDNPEALTVLIIQPRAVRVVYGHIDVEVDDIAYLKRLRATSAAVLADINEPDAMSRL